MLHPHPAGGTAHKTVRLCATDAARPLRDLVSIERIKPYKERAVGDDAADEPEGASAADDQEPDAPPVPTTREGEEESEMGTGAAPAESNGADTQQRATGDGPSRHAAETRASTEPQEEARKRRRVMGGSAETGRQGASEHATAPQAGDRTTSAGLRPQGQPTRERRQAALDAERLWAQVRERARQDEPNPGPLRRTRRGDEFEVETVRDRREHGKRTQYLVRWRGYGAAHDSWEPAGNLHPNLIRDYEQRLHRTAADAVRLGHFEGGGDVTDGSRARMEAPRAITSAGQ